MPLLSYLQKTFTKVSRNDIAPQQGFVVIGDIHGCSDLLGAIVELIAQDAGASMSLVFLGDYVDRGDSSAEVLGLLLALQDGVWPADVTCLKGNHEVMMLDFLADPEQYGEFWLTNGGMHTLASFKISPPAPSASAGDMRAARDKLNAALGKERCDWLRSLPVSYQNGNVLAVHAGADPRRPVGEQTADHLVWGHPEFMKVPRRDGIWVAHGHSIVEQACAQQGRISVDTGAYATGVLSAAVIDENGCRFLTVKRKR